MVDNALCPVPQVLCLAGDMCMGRGPCTPFATVGTLVWMHCPGCASQASSLALHSMLISQQDPSVVLALFEMGNCEDLTEGRELGKVCIPLDFVRDLCHWLRKAESEARVDTELKGPKFFVCRYVEYLCGVFLLGGVFFLSCKVVILG